MQKFIPAYLLTFVNVLGFSILMPVLPFIVESYGAEKWVFGLLLTLYSTFQFIGAPLLGAWSDAKGRKPILLLSQAGTLLAWIVFLIALSLPDFSLLGLAFPLWIIALSRILDGITGGNSSVANAYVADITTRKEKSYIFGYLGGIAGIGMIVGPGLGGIAASTSFGFTGTLLLAAFISTITLIVIALGLKESHPVEKRTSMAKFNFKRMILIHKNIQEVNPSSIIRMLFTVKFFFSAMMGFYIGTISLFLIDLFNFTSKELGFFMFIIGVFLSFNQAIVSKFVIKRLGEISTLITGLFLATIGIISITLTKNIYLFIAFYYIMNLGLSLSFPTFNALISIHANPKKQGEIMGISESINSLCMAIFPVISATLYMSLGFELYYFVSILPFVGFLIALRATKKIGKKAFE